MLSIFRQGSLHTEQASERLAEMARIFSMLWGSSGRGRVAAAKGVLSALRFAAHKLGLTGLVDSLASPVLVSWLASDKWSAVCPKEAYPLPLCVVAKLEIAFVDCGNEDAWLLGCMLLMIWGGLRWSDAQRLQLATLTIDKSSLRARCWRTKTCPSGLTFGVLFCGVTQRNWGSIFAQQLEQLRSRYPLRDFLLDRQGVPLPYASMLGQMRRCLCQYADLQPSQALGFSLHSCKGTTLAWALQLDVPLAMRAAQGHHRLNDCVAKYGRDDVWPQLQCQKRILLAVARGWQPARSLRLTYLFRLCFTLVLHILYGVPFWLQGLSILACLLFWF